MKGRVGIGRSGILSKRITFSKQTIFHHLESYFPPFACHIRLLKHLYVRVHTESSQIKAPEAERQLIEKIMANMYIYVFYRIYRPLFL